MSVIFIIKIYVLFVSEISNVEQMVTYKSWTLSRNVDRQLVVKKQKITLITLYFLDLIIIIHFVIRNFEASPLKS